MSRIQRFIIALFAVVDIAVIGLLGYVVLSHQRSWSTRSMTEPDACTSQVLETLSGTSLSHSVVSYQTSTGELRLDVTLGGPQIHGDIGDAQVIWDALSVLRLDLVQNCDGISELILRIHLETPTGTAHHVACFPGSEALSWAAGDLDADQLAAVSGYRYVEP